MSYIKPKNTLIPWNKQYNLKQKQIVKAEGSFIYTKDEKIIDFTSGAMVVNLGHNNKYIQKAFLENINNGIAYVPSNFSTYQREKLSERLLEQANMENGKVIYCNAGADANEIASFISKEYHYYKNQNTIKKRVLTYENSFHGGSTIGSSLLSGDLRRTEKEKYYKLNLEPILLNPKLEDNGLESLEQIKQKLNKQNISSILIEGSSGSAGCILYPENYIIKLQKLCKENNILVICDEVMSGFGRTGEFFAHFKQNMKPDIITCAKGITSGYIQLGAVIVNKDIANIFDNNNIMCGLTYSGHPLSCLVANNCLDLYLEDNQKIINDVNYKSEIIKNKCIEIVNSHDYIKDYRNNGLLGCFEFNLNEEKLVNLSNLLLKNNIYCLRIRNNIFIAPPLNIKVLDIYDTIFKMIYVFNTFDEKL